MNDKSDSKVHWSFWVIVTVGLVWNVLGSVNFLVQVNADSLAAYREVERAIIEGRPIWATGGFAFAVFGGAIGSVLLLLRKPGAFYMFIASLIGVLVTTTHTINVDIDFSPGEIIVIVVMPLLVAAFLTWYSKRAENKDWI